MGILDDLREKLHIDDREYCEVKKIVGRIEETLNSKDIYFDEQIRVGFYSHMVSFIRRLKKNELVTDVDEKAVLDQIDKENLDLAIKLIKPLFDKFKVEYSYSEIVLIAIYIQTANKN